MKITIAGGGNIGTQFAVHFAEKGHEVIMFTSNPGIFSGSLSIIDKEGNTIHEGKISLATNNPEKAFRGSDAIIITMPPTMMIPLSEMIYENTDESTIIGFVPGNGGFELAFRKCIETRNTFIPDLHSRYFTADFPYGLSVIQQIGNIAGVDMPNIDSLIDWYDEIAIVNDKLIISDYGISDMDTLREFYMQ